MSEIQGVRVFGEGCDDIIHIAGDARYQGHAVCGFWDLPHEEVKCSIDDITCRTCLGIVLESKKLKVSQRKLKSVLKLASAKTWNPDNWIPR